MTALAPAVDNQRTLLSKSPLLEKLCHAIGHPVLITNQSQQIVFANQATVEWVGLKNDRLLQGSLLEDIFNKSSDNLQANAESFTIADETFSLINLDKISKASWRQNLERTFFHDILNTAGGMKGLTEILQDATPDEIPELTDSVKNMADQLVDEIISQRDLLAAETGELRIQTRKLESHILVNSVLNTYRNHGLAENREIHRAPGAKSFIFTSDPVLLGRILGNMVKNALEASPAPAVITLNCGTQGEEVWFSVHNQGAIAKDIRSRIFQESCSTKGAGRGTGTFSMRLFAEKYLGGRMSFETNAATGTTFTVSLPISGP